ncbi:MAG: hypothetical protein HZA50_19435 [Planctomycetes bacterium]|nr:hypothetical protein [Planctomycetota bacterium]
MRHFTWFMGLSAACSLVLAQCACLSINSDKTESDKSASSGDKSGRDKPAGQNIDVSGDSSRTDPGKSQLITGDGDSPTAGRPDVEQVANGTIYWSKSQIVAGGVGKAPAKYAGGQAAAMAMRAARIDAARNALNILINIKIGSSGPDGDIPVQGILKNFEETSCTYDQQTRTAACTIRVKF